MRRQGVITIFLSLILLLFLNFVMTTLEAARITAASHYMELLAENSVNSLKSRYYYPLFEQYGLLAVDGGGGGSMLDSDRILSDMSATIETTVSQSAGGLLRFEEGKAESIELSTLISDNYKAFKEQMMEQAIYEGADLVCGLLAGDSMKATGKVAELQLKQQEAANATLGVSIEILKLMQSVDGVCTTSTGLAKDENGNYKAAESFAKQLCGKNQSALENSYGNSIVFELVKGNIVYADKSVELILELVLKYKKMEASEEKTKLGNQIIEFYDLLQRRSTSVLGSISEAIRQTEILEKVQKVAQSSVLEYEKKLINSEDLDSEILAGLWEDLQQLRDYVGLNESGYKADLIKKTLETDFNVIQSAALPDKADFLNESNEIATETLEMYLRNFVNVLGVFSYTNLKFDYGNLKASDTTEDLLTGSISELFSNGVLTLLGIEEVSNKSIEGSALPSKGGNSSEEKDILELFSEFTALFAKKNPGEMLESAYNHLSEEFLLEVYLANHYASLLDNHDNSTKIDYEREYILYGHEKDKENLAEAAMALIALRGVFCFAALMADAGRNQEATALAETLAVLGVPALCIAVKYLILTVWAIEEAIVETAALLAGKKVEVFNLSGNVNISELLVMSPALVKTKVESMSNSAVGVGYTSYIAILSFLQPENEKIGRALDLIQENIRYRYRDSFRIGNCITNGEIKTKAKLEKLFFTGFFSDGVYEINNKRSFGY